MRKRDTENQKLILRILNLIPQYPQEITKVSLCKQIGIDYNRLNCYLSSVSNSIMIGETESTLTRCEEYYGISKNCG